MATTTTLTAGQISAHAITLTASSVDTVNYADSCDTISVTNVSGGTAIYFTTDGSTPTVGGANTHLCTSITGNTVVVPSAVDSGGSVVKLISSGTPTYSVQRVT